MEETGKQPGSGEKEFVPVDPNETQIKVSKEVKKKLEVTSEMLDREWLHGGSWVTLAGTLRQEDSGGNNHFCNVEFSDWGGNIQTMMKDLGMVVSHPTEFKVAYQTDDPNKFEEVDVLAAVDFNSDKD